MLIMSCSGPADQQNLLGIHCQAQAQLDVLKPDSVYRGGSVDMLAPSNSWSASMGACEAAATG